MQVFYDRFIRIPLPFDWQMFGNNYLDIYYYALFITGGMVLSIFIVGHFFSKKGIHRDNALDYALAVFPAAIIGARLYFLLFPYEGMTYAQYVRQWVTIQDGSVTGINWAHIVNTRGGGLGVYGGVILGYVAVWIVTKVKKLSFDEFGDCGAPAVLLAQSIGRWGNFINGEAFGDLITDPSKQWFPLAVNVDGQWYQATFFYESMATLLGFLFLVLVIYRWKHYRNGIGLAFYGFYYGVVRLIIEGMRSDSLFLILPDFANKTMINTGIKISQAVSVIVICLAIIRTIRVYRKEIGDFLRKIFKKKQPSA